MDNARDGTINGQGSCSRFTTQVKGPTFDGISNIHMQLSQTNIAPFVMQK